MKRINTLLLSALFLFSAASFDVSTSAAEVDLAPAPNFSTKQFNGGTVSLKSLKGTTVILNFWATWCAPCQAEMPDFEKVYRRHKNKKIAIFGVNYKENADDIKEFMKTNSISFPILFDNDGKIAEMFNVVGLPSTFFIDDNGNLAGTVVGAIDEKELEEWIAKLQNKPSTDKSL